MKCRACGAEAVTPLGEKNGFPLWLCDCGSVNAEVPAAGLPNYSESYARATFEAPAAVRKSLADTVESVAAYRRNGRWVDIGFGEGALLAEAQTLGWDCAGSEISKASLDFGRSRGWDARAQSSDWADGSFDVVSMMEVLEHVTDPEGLVREGVRLLRPGGCLVATTPNIGSLNFRVLGVGWSVVTPPEHLTLFSTRALRLLLQKSSLDVRLCRTSGLNPTELRPGRRKAVSARERNAGAQHWVQATANPAGAAMKRVANGVLNVFRAGDSLKVLAVKKATPQ